MNDLNIYNLSLLVDLFQPAKILALLIGIFILYLISYFIKKIAQKLHRRLPNRKIIIFQISTIIEFFINIFGGIFLFYVVLNPPKELILAFIGSAAVAIGLSIKDLVASFISGLTIIIDPPFQVGDRITFNDIYGEIINIGLRSVKVKTLDKDVVTIPNSNFMNNAVICGNPGNMDIAVICNFYVNLDTDLNLAQDILRQTVLTSKYSYLGKPIDIIIDQIWQDRILCLHIKLRAHTIDAKYEKEFQSDIITRGTKYLSEDGIKTPAI